MKHLGLGKFREILPKVQKESQVRTLFYSKHLIPDHMVEDVGIRLRFSVQNPALKTCVHRLIRSMCDVFSRWQHNQHFNYPLDGRINMINMKI